MPHVLTVVGLDGRGSGGPGGRQGMQRCRCYCSSVVIAVTAQNTVGVQVVHSLSEDSVTDQLRSVLSEMDVDVGFAT